MSIIKKSGVARIFLILCVLFSFSSYANSTTSCPRRVARVICHSALTVSSAFLFLSGILAATQPVRQQTSPAVAAGTSMMLLGLGGNGIYNGLRNLFCEMREEIADNQDDQQDEEQG